jgi:hypothetical protein
MASLWRPSLRFSGGLSVYPRVDQFPLFCSVGALAQQSVDSVEFGATAQCWSYESIQEVVVQEYYGSP